MNKRYFPNMNEGKDSPWYPIKKKLCHQIGDITQLWGCSDKHRQLAFSKGIYSWKNEDFSPDVIGFTNPKKIHILENIIAINKQKIHDENFQWMRIDNDFQRKWTILSDKTLGDMMFLDFEYLENGMIYLIGIYYKDEYKSFWAESLNLQGESDLLRNFYDFLYKHPNILVWYWHADKSKWISSCKRHSFMKEAMIVENWYDMCDLMRSGTVTVYGAFSFSLKDIVNAFYQMKKIPFCYNDLDCNNGKSSIHYAIEYYTKNRDEYRYELEKYNKMDCEAMKYILKEIQSYE